MIKKWKAATFQNSSGRNSSYIFIAALYVIQQVDEFRGSSLLPLQCHFKRNISGVQIANYF